MLLVRFEPGAHDEATFNLQALCKRRFDRHGYFFHVNCLETFDSLQQSTARVTSISLEPPLTW